MRIDVTQVKTPSDTKKQSQAPRSESAVTKRVTINAPDDPKTHSKYFNPVSQQLIYVVRTLETLLVNTFSHSTPMM